MFPTFEECPNGRDPESRNPYSQRHYTTERVGRSLHLCRPDSGETGDGLGEVSRRGPRTSISTFYCGRGCSPSWCRSRDLFGEPGIPEGMTHGYRYNPRRVLHGLYKSTFGVFSIFRGLCYGPISFILEPETWVYLGPNLGL